MNFSERLIIVFICMCLCSACKQIDLQDFDTTKNSYRIKKIIRYDELGEELNRDVFNYDEEKLVSCQSCYKNENGEMIQNWKLNIQYKGGNIIKTLSYLRNNKWTLHQECKYTICNNLVREKVVSRLASPKCIECWKYKFKYQKSEIVEWSKFLKTETNEWLQIRKNTFTYCDSKLIECKDSVTNDNSELKLDYRKYYVYENGKVLECFGGICINDHEWKPTQKTEYTYEQNNISTKTYFVWNSTDESWKNFGFVKYCFDENNYLIKETTSSGIQKLYEYEKGHGNTALIYFEPEDINPIESMIKSTQFMWDSIF